MVHISLREIQVHSLDKMARCGRFLFKAKAKSKIFLLFICQSCQGASVQKKILGFSKMALHKTRRVAPH